MNTTLAFLKQHIVPIGVFVLIEAFWASLALHKIDFSIDDLGRHIKNGELILHGQFDVLFKNVYSLTDPNSPFINHHWLSGVVFYLLNQTIGFGGITIFGALILLLAFGILFLAALRKADFWLVALFSLPTILMLAERSDARPEIFSYLFIAIFIYALLRFEEQPQSNAIFWLIPVQILWVNLHIFFPIGLMLVGGVLIEKILLRWRRAWGEPIVRKTALLLLFLAFACLLNPNTLAGALYPLTIAQTVNANFQVQETVMPFFTDSLWRDVSVMVLKFSAPLLVLSFLFGLRRKPIWYALASAGSFLSAFFMERNIPLFAMIFLPAITANFNGVFMFIRERLRWKLQSWYASFAFASALALAGVFLAFAIYGAQGKLVVTKEPGIGLLSNSGGAANFILSNDLHGPIFNNYDIGSYLVYYLYPMDHVFVDNRPEAYPSSFFSDVYEPALSDSAAWQKLDDQYHFNLIVFYLQDASWEGGNFIWQRINDPTWAVVYAGPHNIVFLRNTPENFDTIEANQVTAQNVGDRVGYLVNSDNRFDVYAAGYLYYLFTRDDLANAALSSLLKRWPDEGTAWTLMGVIAGIHNDPVSAANDFEQAIATGEKTARVYALLGVAYFQQGRYTDAKKALLQSLYIDPTRQDAQNALAQTEAELK